MGEMPQAVGCYLPCGQGERANGHNGASRLTTPLSLVVAAHVEDLWIGRIGRTAGLGQPVRCGKSSTVWLATCNSVRTVGNANGRRVETHQGEGQSNCGLLAGRVVDYLHGNVTVEHYSNRGLTWREALSSSVRPLSQAKRQGVAAANGTKLVGT
jgi:hypothetical protein